MTAIQEFARWFMAQREIDFEPWEEEYIGASDSGNMCWMVTGIVTPQELPVPIGSLFAAEYAGATCRQPREETVFVWGYNVGLDPVRAQ